MLSVESGPRLGTVETIVTSGRGLNPEELVRLYLPKIIFVSPELPEAERAAGEAQKDAIEALLLRAFAQAQKSQNTSIFNVLMDTGHESAAELVRSL